MLIEKLYLWDCTSKWLVSNINRFRLQVKFKCLRKNISSPGPAKVLHEMQKQFYPVYAVTEWCKNSDFSISRLIVNFCVISCMLSVIAWMTGYSFSIVFKYRAQLRSCLSNVTYKYRFMTYVVTKGKKKKKKGNEEKRACKKLSHHVMVVKFCHSAEKRHPCWCCQLIPWTQVSSSCKHLVLLRFDSSPRV